jgi:hypothetical protein
VRTRLEFLGLAVAALIATAFLVSFLAGLGRDAAPPSPPPAPAVVADPPPSPAAGIRVEVLNGSGRSGLARAITDRLREAGFDVVYFGNAGRAADTTMVLARTGEAEGARAVAAHLGISTVRAQPDSTLLLDVTVLLGKDWPAPREPTPAVR